MTMFCSAFGRKRNFACGCSACRCIRQSLRAARCEDLAMDRSERGVSPERHCSVRTSRPSGFRFSRIEGPIFRAGDRDRFEGRGECSACEFKPRTFAGTVARSSISPSFSDVIPQKNRVTAGAGAGEPLRLLCFFRDAAPEVLKPIPIYI